MVGRYIYIYIYVYTYSYVCMHIYIYIHVQNKYVYLFTRTHTHTLNIFFWVKHDKQEPLVSSFFGFYRCSFVHVFCFLPLTALAQSSGALRLALHGFG